MSHGYEKTNVKKRCLRVNEQGFISLYAMLLLLIFLCFATLLVQRVAAYAAVRGLRESYDLFAIHSCRKYLQKEEPPKEWEELFQNTYFHFTREEAYIAVSYTQKNHTVHMQVYFDQTDGTIQDVVYLQQGEPH